MKKLVRGSLLVGLLVAVVALASKFIIWDVENCGVWGCRIDDLATARAIIRNQVYPAYTGTTWRNGDRINLRYGGSEASYEYVNGEWNKYVGSAGGGSGPSDCTALS